MPFDKLIQERNAFWSTRKKNKVLWEVLKECCEADSDTALILLQAANMSCVEGDLRKVIFNGKNEYIFKIPNYCICDPVFERDYNEIKKKEENIEQKNINIIICYRNEENKIVEKKIENVTNKTGIGDLKKKFAEIIGINLEKNKIRFLYKGFELLNENLLWYDKVENNSKIQCLITLIENQ